MKRGAPDHFKMRRLARALQIPLYSANGLVLRAVHFTADSTPRGDIGARTDMDIADACAWEGDATQLVDALVSAGWLDRSEEHRLVVHDWRTHADDSTHARVARSKKLFVDGERPRFNKLSAREREEAEAFYGESQTPSRRDVEADGNLAATRSDPAGDLSAGRQVENSASPSPSPKPSSDEEGETAPVAAATRKVQIWQIWPECQKAAAKYGVRWEKLSPARLKHMTARLAENPDEPASILVEAIHGAKWSWGKGSGDFDPKKFLRPETIYAAENFTKYLEAARDRSQPAERVIAPPALSPEDQALADEFARKREANRVKLLRDQAEKRGSGPLAGALEQIVRPGAAPP
jgi:hypothetical protein